MTSRQAFLGLAAVAALTGVPALASAQLVYLGPNVSSGTGIGTVNTVLTVQGKGNSTTESGCVTLSGFNTCAGFGTDAKNGASQTGVRSISGVTGSNLRVVLNFDEPANASGGTLNNAVVTLFSGSNSISSTPFSSPITFNNTFNGIGQSGFLFGLSASDATLFQSFINANADTDNFMIGIGATLSDVTGGPETFYTGIASTNPPTSTVPEPGSMALMGTGLVGLVPTLRRNRKK